MIEAAALRQVWAEMLEIDGDKTGVVQWRVLEEVLGKAEVNLASDCVEVVEKHFTSKGGVRYQELLRNLHTSLSNGERTWRVYRPAFTFESRNLRESDTSTLSRHLVPAPAVPSRPVVSVISQLQQDRVDYLALGLARENFKRLDRENTGQLSPQMFENCFRNRSISPVSMKLLKDSSAEQSGSIAFSKFNQIIEKYKYAPSKPSSHRLDTDDHSWLSQTTVLPISSSKRITTHIQQLSAKLQAKYTSAAAAFRAFRHGESVSLQQFSTKLADLGLDLTPEETQEVFAHISQGCSDLTFEQFQSAFEAVSPRPVRPQLPRLALTPERFPKVRRKDQLPSDRSPQFAYGLGSKKSDNIQQLLQNQFAASSPRKTLWRRAVNRTAVSRKC